ncbi:hypothetical protein IQ270_26145 [Microcoleus sp. LEGE 07076]|uniref:hypothetical protein n=1 Tax=Microcoleus sp. LEGE 07076 TaxID=915322 RepID=UPI00188000F6|nr:hypothetical protein [Microcoleus sp. LEGE 07076]MBE9188027.1 hypothetical protein [Microcoleus sp. LEGE 07076]
MFLDELIPVVKELIQQPIAFAGGFFSGLLRLNLHEDPVRSWIDEQAGSTSYTPPSAEVTNTKSTGPQSISID